MLTHSSGIESSCFMLKRGYYGIYHNVGKKHLERYVCEFAGRQSAARCTPLNGREAAQVSRSGGGTIDALLIDLCCCGISEISLREIVGREESRRRRTIVTISRIGLSAISACLLISLIRCGLSTTNPAFIFAPFFWIKAVHEACIVEYEP